MMRDLWERGPIVVYLYATGLFNYASGVYNPSNCPTNFNHAVALIGWGTQSGVNYWIAKNSWDKTWGENGYFRIIRDKNMCGINKKYSYPILTNAVPYNKYS